MNFDDEINKLYEKLNKLKKTTYSKLDAWQKTTMARHPMRFGLLDKQLKVCVTVCQECRACNDRFFGIAWR